MAKSSKIKQTADLLNKRFKFWVEVAQYYGFKAEEPTLKIYAFDVADFHLEDLGKAFKQWRTDEEKGKKMPLPVDLLAILMPRRANKDLANEIVANLLLFCKCYDPYGKYSLEAWRKWTLEHYGESTQAVMDRIGGPSRLYRQVNECGSMETWKAQTRDLSLAVLNASEKGILDVPPALPSSSPDGVKKLVESGLKSLPGGKK